MPDAVPIERLHPCLLDRLTDDEPQNREESRLQRSGSHQSYRDGVLRDLEWLFNSQGYLNAGFAGGNSGIREYPEILQSVLNFGARQLCGLTTLNLEDLRQNLAEAIRTFEPRITPRTLTIRANVELHYVRFEIEGDLWANPVPEHLHVTTKVDLETGHCLLGDMPYG